jgi:hypothetical protein
MRRFIFGALMIALAACSHNGAGAGPTPSAPAAAHAYSPFDFMPADTAMVFGINVQQLVDTEVYRRFAPMLTQYPQAHDVLRLSKEVCHIDLLRDIKSIVISMDAALSDGRMVMLIDGDFDEPKITRCFVTLDEHAGNKKMTAATSGGITAYTGADGKTLYLGWATPHTILLTDAGVKGDPTYVASLLAGKTSARNNGDLMLLAEQARTDAGAWMVMLVTGKIAQDMGSSPAELPRGIWVDVDFDDRGSLSLEVGARFADPALARAAGDKATVEIEELRKNPEVAPYLSSLRVLVRGGDALFSITLDAAQVNTVLDLVMSNLPALIGS